MFIFFSVLCNDVNCQDYVLSMANKHAAWLSDTDGRKLKYSDTSANEDNSFRDHIR
jgi:hypothetical protein